MLNRLVIKYMFLFENYTKYVEFLVSWKFRKEGKTHTPEVVAF